MRIRKTLSPSLDGASVRRVFLGVLLAALVGVSASAHRLAAIDEVFPSAAQALRIENLDVSQVVYVELTSEEPELWVTFTVAEPTDLYMQLGLPALDRLVDYRPRITVVRPEGEEFSEVAAFDTVSIRTPRFFHEPFTGTDSWILLEETVEITTPGTYYIVTSTVPEDAGKLWVAVGRTEAFTLEDALTLPSVIRSVRVFHEVGARGPTPLEWATLLGIMILGLVLVLAATEGAG